MMHGLNTTRRGILGALAAMPPIIVAAGIPLSPAAASTLAWQQTLKAFDDTEAEYTLAVRAFGDAEERFIANRPSQSGHGQFFVGDTVEAYHSRLSDEKRDYEAAVASLKESTGCNAAEMRLQAASAATYGALAALMQTPAPDVGAATRKLEIAIAEGLEGSELDPVVADFRRLAGEA